MLVRSSAYGMGKILVKGTLSSLREFSMINPESINGLSIVSEYVTYWIRIIGEDCFEILSGSNLLGRSTINLLEIRRTDGDKWTVEQGSGNKIIPSQIVIKGNLTMAQGVFDILADFGNPYQRDQEFLCSDYYNNQLNEYLIDVNEGILRVNGNAWFPFPNF